MLEAVWDPVSNKVVFKDTSKKNNDKDNKKDEDENRIPQQQQTRQSTNKNNNNSNNDKKSPSSPPLDWRQAEEENRETQATTPSRRRSRGIPTSRFYQPDPQKQQLHQSITQHVIQHQTKAQLQQQTIQRAAFYSVSAYKTFPLQELAVSKFQDLRRAWGVPEEDETNTAETTTPNNSSNNIARSYSGESNDSTSSYELETNGVMEAKRCSRGQSPAQSRQYQQYVRMFMQQQKLPAMQMDPTVFGPAIYCLEPRIIAMETFTGKRKYVACNMGRFLDTYWRKMPDAKHCYELIRPGHTPCRLYLDIECELRHNADLNITLQETLLEELYHELAAELSRVCFGQNVLKLQRSDICDLDSSRPGKFSRHWIVHLQTMTKLECLFPNNHAVGQFVKNFVGRLANEHATGQLKQRRPVLDQFLFVKTSSKNNNRTTCLIDVGVYSRNRIFRLLGSWKFGKSPESALRIADSNTFPFPNNFDNSWFYNLQTAAVAGENDIDDQVRKNVARFDWTVHAEALAQTLVVPLNCAKINYPILQVMEPILDEPPSQSVMRNDSNRTKPQTVLARGTSPYPMIDEFVLEELATRGDTQGTIRVYSVQYDQNKTPVSVTYQMLRNRWCENVGRPHKSNNIAWTVDFVRRHCYQTCHDPDCRGFRGTPVHIPDAVWDALQDVLFEEELKTLEIFDDDDDSFEEALSALNLNALTTSNHDATSESQDLNNMSTNNKSVSSGAVRDGSTGDTKCDDSGSSSDDSDDDDEYLLELARKCDAAKQSARMSQLMEMSAGRSRDASSRTLEKRGATNEQHVGESRRCDDVCARRLEIADHHAEIFRDSSSSSSSSSDDDDLDLVLLARKRDAKLLAKSRIMESSAKKEDDDNDKNDKGIGERTAGSADANRSGSDSDSSDDDDDDEYLLQLARKCDAAKKKANKEGRV